ncbi:MAG: ABC transporter ATP-binding protein [Sphaerochaetaceae bacterium]|nr:ABC transporter ATP-binding protein [Sphaerochaetaceae bacterium]
MPEIVLKNITKKWGGFTAVENLDLKIEDGAFITLLGPSGCGKTTTLRMIAGLETPSSGEITIDGKVVFSSDKGINISAAKRDVGFLFQNYALWPHMTVYQNIAFGLETLKWKKPDIEKRVSEMLDTMQIQQFAQRYPSELSGGQQQRVAIARTLAPKPKVLFMDEPLSNLDAKLRGEMRTELKRLHIDTGSTFVYVTHDQLEAMTMATKICLMKEGVLQQYDAPLDVYALPANRFVADFVGNPTMNFIDGKVKVTGKRTAQLEFLGSSFVFHAKEDINLQDGDVTIGIRPESLPIAEKGKAPNQITGSAYSTLPAGMETTVKIKVGNTILSSVMFGSLDYKVDSEVHFSILGDRVLLFNMEGKRVASGSVEKKGE